MEEKFLPGDVLYCNDFNGERLICLKVRPHLQATDSEIIRLIIQEDGSTTLRHEWGFFYHKTDGAKCTKIDRSVWDRAKKMMNITSVSIRNLIKNELKNQKDNETDRLQDREGLQQSDQQSDSE